VIYCISSNGAAFFAAPFCIFGSSRAVNDGDANGYIFGRRVGTKALPIVLIEGQ
jgi:hypothetical protein